MGCIRHSADFALKDKNWLHNKIKYVAKKVVGVDYLPSEIEKLKAYGYDIVFGDVNKLLNIDENFDVIVAGDLIEHLTNFEGFFGNCNKLLSPHGILIITTPNPFYTDKFHFVSFKKTFIANPEHTCNIDPQTLSQLSGRFGYVIDEMYYIKNSWGLGRIICDTNYHEYDILNAKWVNDSFKFKILRGMMRTVFNIFYIPYKIFSGTNTKLVRYGDYLAVLHKENQGQ